MIGGWLTWDTLNSNLFNAFVTSAIGALAGAWGGAYAIQRIAEKARKKEQLLQEILNSNAAFEVAHGLGSTYLNFKEQNVVPLVKQYREQREAVIGYLAEVENGRVARGTQFVLGGVSYQTLNLPPMRLERLDTLVSERLSVRGRPRPLVATLMNTAATLHDAIQKRNEMIAYLKTIQPSDLKFELIFGLPMKAGHIDTTFGDFLDAISSYTDDCIQFCMFMCDDMSAHGGRNYREFRRRYRRSEPPPAPKKVLWVTAEKKGMLPDVRKYVSWQTGFLEPVEKSKRWSWKQVRYWAKKKGREWFGQPERTKRPPKRLGW
jgi:hypothetical protein